MKCPACGKPMFISYLQFGWIEAECINKGCERFQMKDRMKPTFAEI